MAKGAVEQRRLLQRPQLCTNLLGVTEEELNQPLSIRVWTSRRNCEIAVSDARLEIGELDGKSKVYVIATDVERSEMIWCIAGPASTRTKRIRERWANEYPAIKARRDFKTIDSARDYARSLIQCAPLAESLILHSGLTEQNLPTSIEVVSGSYAEAQVMDTAGASTDEVERLILSASNKSVLEALALTQEDDLADLDLEGARSYRLQQFRERSDGNRLRVLKEKGHTCEACGFEFAKQFTGLSPSAHVHHKNPLALGERRAISIDEFAVLCAPCHTAAHMGQGRKLNPRTVEDLRRLIRAHWGSD